MWWEDLWLPEEDWDSSLEKAPPIVSGIPGGETGGALLEHQIDAAARKV